MTIGPSARPITKTDIIEMHINASIEAIAFEINPYSTHLLVTACDELVMTMARKHAVELPFDGWLKPEARERFYQNKKKAANYFKHADRDFDKPYNGPAFSDLQRVNDIQTLICITAYELLGHKASDTMVNFQKMCGLHYEFYIDWSGYLDSDPEFKRLYDEVDPPVDRSVFLIVLRRSLLAQDQRRLFRV